MPDLQNYSVTRTGNTVTRAIPEFAISGQVCDSQSGAVLADFSGPNAILFPQVWATLTVAQRQQLVEKIARDLITVVTGL